MRIFKHITLLLLLMPALVFSQTEAGVFMGFTNYMGDLAGSTSQRRHLEVMENNLGFGVLAKHAIHPRFAVRGSFTVGKISGSDGAADSESRRNRNLHFRSMVYELNALAEFNIFNMVDNARHGKVNSVSSPYLFLGVGGFYFNPQAEAGGKWYDLHDYGTEGQRMEEPAKRHYKRVQLCIPMGVGFRYSISNIGNIGLEVGLRKTFTDYLDDVSGNYPNIALLDEQDQMAADLSYRALNTGHKNPAGRKRGNAKGKDWYMFAGFVITTDISKPKARKKP